MKLEAWLREGPFHLSLSSGFFGFYAHAGFLQALVDAGSLPASVSGSSAGALVGGCWAAGMKTSEIVAELLGLQRSSCLVDEPEGCL